MNQVTVDDAFGEQLKRSGPDVQVRGRDGQVLGYFLTPEEYRKLVYAWARAEASNLDVDQARDEYRRQGGLTTAQVLERLNRIINERAGGA